MAKKTKLMAVALAAIAAASLTLTACTGSGENFGEKEKGNRTEILFLCDANETSSSAWGELIVAYNDGQGMEDGVYVSANIEAGASSPQAGYFIDDPAYAYNVLTLNDNQNSGFATHAIGWEPGYAPDGYLVNLQPYAEADEDFQKNTIPDSLMNWFRMKFNKNADKGAGSPKNIMGAGQNLMAVPIGTNPQFNWYNEALFKAQGINIISVEEEKLDGTGTYAKVQPHGYAEYKNEPFAGAVKSKNLANQDVYKVFNNRIGMNWEEQRNLLKYFTPEYNSSATTEYGFVSEYWFNYGWSVGGDVMGYNGTEYDFTLLDDRPNYIVTKDNTVINGATYMAGEIVRYEDRVNGIEKAATKPENIYAIESQYNAVKEYVSLQVTTGTTVDTHNGVTYKGYGVASPDLGSADNWFNTAQIAMVRGTTEAIRIKMEQKSADDYNMCPAETYREYEGGSVYYDGGTGFANEYLKVIGEEYDGKVYTGAIKVVGDAKIIGNTTTASISHSLCIPACSDPAKYQAAWDFISWVATDGQKYIAKTQTLSPAATDVLFSEDYAYNEELNYGGKNLYAVAMMSASAGRGDWGYFESGRWVNNWSGDFNDKVRQGRMTLTAFNDSKKAAAKTALNDMYSIIKGIR